MAVHVYPSPGRPHFLNQEGLDKGVYVRRKVPTVGGFLLFGKDRERYFPDTWIQDPPGGRIINNGSISAQSPRPASVAYSATKHAITGLTKSISLDGRAYDITCGQIDIGNAATEMTSAVSSGGHACRFRGCPAHSAVSCTYMSYAT